MNPPGRTLAGHLDDYLTLRRALGCKLIRAERYLRQFLDYLGERQQGTLTAGAAADWVRRSRHGAVAPGLGMEAVRGFAVFLHAHNPPLRLIVVGAVHIAQALVQFAPQCGYATTVVDPRRSFGTEERFPGVEISHAWPDEAMEEFKPNSRTAVVTLTHDPKLDDPALDRALKSEAFYIGALGSRRTHAARLKRLRDLGHNDNVLSRIRGPVGLNIEAVTAPEIAASIIAEIIAVRRGAPLPEKPMP